MALPPSSPRLPSPPPPAEIQIGPKSPAASGATLAQQQIELQIEQTLLDANSKRRIHPGTRTADFAAGPPLVPLQELDSAFQLQEHLAALHYFHTANNTVPISRDTARTLAQAPPGTDRTLWLYELCRFLIAQCNSLIVGFLFDTPPCSAATCPEMRASEWQFLCAVHEQPRSCCAIDYCCHTLDWAANVVTNPKIFPSRFVFADQHDKNAALKNMVNVFRRLHRIFAHAWFQHRGVFWSVEGQTGLYVLFKTVCDMYDLLSAENYKLPPEAEGLDMGSSLPSAGAATGGAAADAAAAAAAGGSPPESTPGLIQVSSIADRKSFGFGAAAAGTGMSSSPGSAHRAGPGPAGGSGGLAPELFGGDSEHHHSIGRTNTRRHIRSSPSTGSAVTTVLEQDEDGGAAGASASSLAPGRPESILQNNHAVPSPARAAAASVYLASAPPSLPERHGTASHEAETDGDGSGGDAESAEVPVIVQDDQQDWTPIAPTGSSYAPGGADLETTGPEEEGEDEEVGSPILELLPVVSPTAPRPSSPAAEPAAAEPSTTASPADEAVPAEDGPVEAGAADAPTAAEDEEPEEAANEAASAAVHTAVVPSTGAGEAPPAGSTTDEAGAHVEEEAAGGAGEEETETEAEAEAGGPATAAEGAADQPAESDGASEAKDGGALVPPAAATAEPTPKDD